jgi:hypothetical protein
MIKFSNQLPKLWFSNLNLSTTTIAVNHEFIELSTFSTVNSKTKTNSQIHKFTNNMLNSISELYNLKLEKVNPTLTLIQWITYSFNNQFCNLTLISITSKLLTTRNLNPFSEPYTYD